ncbi:MAG: hypothetical protein Q8922_01050 [Bacteroidota bacterium]|nr:hypothetical protein [Bacteroidota bacterium]MDP4232184.1 hypothetical protein [Bacteroidota bacterium]MDP4241108.1 hypothetical protein [Bacteroidota bacterium]MDP4286500.1 hypothetical protein [Bacteroidota bacterium]
MQRYSVLALRLLLIGIVAFSGNQEICATIQSGSPNRTSVRHGAVVASPVRNRGELSRLWHEAGLASTRNDPTAARDTYRLLLKVCSFRQTSSATWYAAMAEFGIARTSSRIAASTQSPSDSAETRLALLKALKCEFWNFEVLERDSILSNVAGRQWFDSLVSVYKVLRQISTQTWTPQPPLLILPVTDPIVAARLPASFPHRPITTESVLTMDSTQRAELRIAQTIPLDDLNRVPASEMIAIKHRPLVITLHGGCASYREFSHHWFRVADSLGLSILVPPGTVRHGEDMNSWEGSIESIDEDVSAVLDRFEQESGAQPETYVAGFSQGATAAIKIGIMHPDRYRGVFSVAGLLDGPLPDELLRTSADAGLCIYAMSGEFDSPNFRASLEAAGRQCMHASLPFKLEIIPDVIHEVPRPFAMYFGSALNWIKDRQAARVAQSSMVKSRQ